MRVILAAATTSALVVLSDGTISESIRSITAITMMARPTITATGPSYGYYDYAYGPVYGYGPRIRLWGPGAGVEFGY